MIAYREEIPSRLNSPSVVLPADFVAKDRGISVVFRNEKGEISLIRKGTIYDNLKDNLITFDSRKSFRVSDMQSEKIEGYDVMTSEELIGNTKKKQNAYYIFAGNLVFIFSTNSESLYDKLNQIARFFQYIR